MIRAAREGGCLTLALARPDKANALTRAMLTRLADEVEGAAGRDRVLVLTGEGRAFSAGMDLDEAATGLPTDPVWERLSGAIAAFPGLTIAALNGTVAGGAMGMVLACDIRLAVPGARFFYPVMRLGFLPQPSDPGRLCRIVGRARAAMLLMGGAKIGAEEALSWGLVDRIVPAETLLPEAAALAADTLAAAPEHAAAIKGMLG